MEYTLSDLIRLEHILINLEVEDSKQVIYKMTEALAKDGYVTMEFADDVWEREQKFATGLPTEPIGVAIPHADPDHVNKSAVCIGILKNPVSFAQMGGDGSKMVAVKIVFLLAIKEKEKQVTMIQQLVNVIQTPKLLEALCEVESEKAVLDLLQRKH